MSRSTPAAAPTVIPQPICDFLAAPRFATIATIGPNGAPHQAVVWYALDGDTLYVNSRRERRWPRNLERDARINVAVHDHEKLGHWVGLRGTAEVARTGDAAIEDIAAMARRYGGDPAGFKGQDRVTFAVRVDRTYEYWS
jgi:PPOX class probable F420-dependent enzyme